MNTSISSTTPWVTEAEPAAPVSLALADLARDWRAVFSRQPRMFSRATTNDEDVVLVLGMNAVRQEVGETRELDDEQFVIEVRTATIKGRMRTAICAYGAGVRGEIYAIYAVSSQLLGIDPFWFWTDHEAPRRSTIAVKPDLCLIAPAPQFRYRGWFMNDEDLLSGWGRDPLGSSGIDAQVWDRIFETILRCNGNLVVPGTFIFATEPQLVLASERGLIIGQHHVQVLGLNAFRWPADKEYSFTSAPELLVEAWEESVQAFGDREVLWSIGYRGLHDRPFWLDDAAAGTTMAERGAIISAALQKQVEIVRRHRPDDDFVINLWLEGADLMRSGDLSVPDGVIVVWADDGHGVIVDGGHAEAGHGIYYHTAMYSGVANHLSEGVPIALMASEIGRLVSSGATEHLLVNVSNIRPVVLTTAAIMEISWGDVSDLDRFYERWATKQYGADCGAAVGSLWRRYFDAGWKFSPDASRKVEDNAYQTYSRTLLASAAFDQVDDVYVYGDYDFRIPEVFAVRGSQTYRQFAEFLKEGTAAVQDNWRQLLADTEALIPAIPEERSSFFLAHSVTQAALHLHGNALLHHVASAAIAISDKDFVTARADLDLAIAQAEATMDRMRDAEYGRWTDWYGEDLFVGVAETLEFARILRDRIQAGRWPLAAEERDLMPLLSAFSAHHYDRLTSYQVNGRVSKAL